MLEVNNLYKAFGSTPVLSGLSLSLKEGGIHGLIGPGGGGKSILMKILGGVLPADAGSIEGGALKASEVDLMFQEGALFDSLTVFDNIAFPLVDGRVPAANLPVALKQEITEKVYAILTRVGLEKAAFKMPAQISGGMRRRVSLARALVGKPKLALLDDPTSGLDPVASSVIMELIVEFHADYNPTMMIVSHDLRRLLPIVEHNFALFDGKVAFSGTLEELVHTDHQKLREFVSCRYDLDGQGDSGETHPA